jgi:hypothetical protein
MLTAGSGFLAQSLADYCAERGEKWSFCLAEEGASNNITSSRLNEVL